MSSEPRKPLDVAERILADVAESVVSPVARREELWAAVLAFRAVRVGATEAVRWKWRYHTELVMRFIAEGNGRETANAMADAKVAADARSMRENPIGEERP